MYRNYILDSHYLMKTLMVVESCSLGRSVCTFLYVLEVWLTYHPSIYADLELKLYYD